MKAYAQYQIHPLAAPSYSGPDTSRIMDACGSDSILPLDGRLSPARMLATATAHGERINRNLGKGYVRVEIRRGDLKQSRPIAAAML